jgi:hypothetical protein
MDQDGCLVGVQWRDRECKTICRSVQATRCSRHINADSSSRCENGSHECDFSRYRRDSLENPYLRHGSGTHFSCTSAANFVSWTGSDILVSK